MREWRINLLTLQAIDTDKSVSHKSVFSPKLIIKTEKHARW